MGDEQKPVAWARIYNGDINHLILEERPGYKPLYSQSTVDALEARVRELEAALRGLYYAVKTHQFTPPDTPESRMSAADMDDCMDYAKAVLAKREGE